MYLGYLKMTYMRCPSDPDDDRRRRTDFSQTAHLGNRKASTNILYYVIYSIQSTDLEHCFNSLT